MADSTLTAIRTKVRRLTRSMSDAQLSTALIDEYVNTFVLYDMPEHLRQFSLHSTYSFYTNPYQDTYPTDEDSFIGVLTNPLYNFQNKFITVNPPVFIAGFPALYSQDRTQFFSIYPLVNSISSIGTSGDGVTTTFTGVVNSQQPGIPNISNNIQVGLLQRQVLFSSVGVNNEGLALVDVPLTDTVSGNKLSVGNLYVAGTEPTVPVTVVDPTNTINYATGVFTITFNAAPGTGQQIFSQTVPQVLGLPQALLFYDNTFVVRPLPDQPYKINFEVYARPVDLLASNEKPKLEEWWQYIAYGAAKKVFEDRMDTDSVQQILPEYRKQENLCLRRTLVQYSNVRTSTIYTEQTNPAGYNGGWYGSSV